MISYEQFIDKLPAGKKAWFGTIGPRDHKWTVDEIVRRAGKLTGDLIDRASVMRYLNTKGFANAAHALDLNAEDTGVPPSELAAIVEEAITTTFGLERDLQVALRREIAQLEDGLTIVDGSKEKSVPSGRIDITAKDADGKLVVIELKAGEAGYEAVAQIAAYIGDLMESGNPVRGILVAGSFHPRAISAARPLPALELKTYSIAFTFQTVAKKT